ncbi:hypothetical protein BU15DRAFT_76084 [Melanogaster broomeanus]|nr:hypothetical protein BU15DRAFT_76084 [Melanogaster broomeanus]
MTLSPKYNPIVMYQNSLDENDHNSESLGTPSPCWSLLLNALDRMDANQIDLEEDKLYSESEPEAPLISPHHLQQLGRNENEQILTQALKEACLLRYVTFTDLKDMEFKFSEIAAPRDAVEQWAVLL